MVFIIAILAFVTVVGVGFVLTGQTDTEKTAQRAKSLKEGKGGKNRGKDADNNRRKQQTQQVLQKLRDDEEMRRRFLLSNDIENRLQQAGLEMSPLLFWVISALIGGVGAIVVFATGIEGPPPVMGVEIKAQPAMIVLAAVFAGFLLPRWGLKVMMGMRQKKMTVQFADSIDVIVRGVKSGLPLNECLAMIGRESPEPLGPEFQSLCQNLQMGTTVEVALQQLYKRIPLPEVNFFVIVLTIQTKSGGNLSEALGNLSAVIRSRKMMREKIKALSSEAKASAMIIGFLPFAVACLIYMTTPSYIMELFITETGHSILFMAGGLMIIGITVMRKMINLDI